MTFFLGALSVLSEQSERAVIFLNHKGAKDAKNFNFFTNRNKRFVKKPYGSGLTLMKLNENLQGDRQW